MLSMKQARFLLISIFGLCSNSEKKQKVNNTCGDHRLISLISHTPESIFENNRLKNKCEQDLELNSILDKLSG